MTGVKAQAEALLNGITPGEWVADYFGDGMYALSGVKPGTLDEDLQNIGVFKTGDGYGRSADCALMMAAPTLARQVVELAEEVERLRGLIENRAAHWERMARFMPHGVDVSDGAAITYKGCADELREAFSAQEAHREP